MIFAMAGTFHITRYFNHWEFRVGGFELTYFGSLVIGTLLALLSIACFKNSR